MACWLLVRGIFYLYKVNIGKRDRQFRYLLFYGSKTPYHLYLHLETINIQIVLGVDKNACLYFECYSNSKINALTL